MKYLSRYQEKRSDLESANTLKLASAGASACEKIRKKWICKQESTFNPSNILYKISDTFGIYHSHPELHDRSEYLLKLAEEQALELEA
jgi:Zn-dependent protease with chaperone function